MTSPIVRGPIEAYIIDRDVRSIGQFDETGAWLDRDIDWGKRPLPSFMEDAVGMVPGLSGLLELTGQATRDSDGQLLVSSKGQHAMQSFFPMWNRMEALAPTNEEDQEFRKKRQATSVLNWAFGAGVYPVFADEQEGSAG